MAAFSSPWSSSASAFPAVFRSKIPLWKKANLVMLFFLLRNLVLPFYSFTLFYVILPLTMFVPEAELPIWVICYIPVLMSILNILPAPKSFPFVIPFALAEDNHAPPRPAAKLVRGVSEGGLKEWGIRPQSATAVVGARRPRRRRSSGGAASPLRPLLRSTEAPDRRSFPPMFSLRPELVVRLRLLSLPRFSGFGGFPRAHRILACVA